MKLLILATYLFLSACSTQPQLLNYTAPVATAAPPARLTDWGILKFGEDQILHWGGRSDFASILSTGGALTVLTVTTASLAMVGQVDPNVTRGGIAGLNWLLGMMNIIQPAQRNDYLIRGQQDIRKCRGEFAKALGAKGIVVISTKQFTHPGAIYLDCIGSAQSVVDKNINGIRLNAEDLQRLEPTPIEKQTAPPPEIVRAINAEAGNVPPMPEPQIWMNHPGVAPIK